MVKIEKISDKEPSLEVVERKGVGHPDTLCDLIAEKSSQKYMAYFTEKYNGRVGHHWFDKVMLVGGESDFGFGYGKIVKPYQLYLVGKAALTVGEDQIPIKEIFASACKEVLTSVLVDFDAENWAEYNILVTDYQGPQNKSNRYQPKVEDDLVKIDDTQIQVSNDCNFCCSYYPNSPAEKLVLAFEGYLNSPEIKKSKPYVGCDIKIFATRRGKDIDFVVRMPFVAKYTPDIEFYKEKKAEIKRQLEDIAHEVAPDYHSDIQINEADPPGQVYLTVTGTVADTGDVGVVGRGNRVNGLITPMRPQSIEAAAGKNPIDHTGKLYSIAAKIISKDIGDYLKGYVEVYMNSSKHLALEDADSVLVRSRNSVSESQKMHIKELVSKELLNIKNYTQRLANGEFELC